MKVEIHSDDDEFVAADGGGWVPGTYPTKEAAARAAWNMRYHGTPEDLIPPVANNDHRESA